jgi:hypothetical protein
LTVLGTNFASSSDHPSNSSPARGGSSVPRLSSRAKASGISARRARWRKKSAVRNAAIFSATATLMNWFSVVPSALASQFRFGLQ